MNSPWSGPGLSEWVDAQLVQEHVMVMGARTYRQMAEIVDVGDDPSFRRMAQLPLTWANTTVIAEPVETAMPALKARADGLPMRTIGSPSLVRSLFRLGLVDQLDYRVTGLMSTSD